MHTNYKPTRIVAELVAERADLVPVLLRPIGLQLDVDVQVLFQTAALDCGDYIVEGLEHWLAEIANVVAAVEDGTSAWETWPVRSRTPVRAHDVAD